ncbi:RNA-binding (RRM/RBD/RNP motifs) family protein [Striga asiatica]|uniref:RNA-binding (RRM/RBD/RNP motifs) family protein n=1 Tax=Striga asiatica TaxID=4170 RepID=A0A5A7PQC3_STRAF|nr:RNA-binding (RRM/RBD/RNP motifs) family protein [Striga asiatica]
MATIAILVYRVGKFSAMSQFKASCRAEVDILFELYHLTTSWNFDDLLLYLERASIRRPRPLPWQNGLFEDSLKAAGLSGMDAGTKLYISNLDFGVSNEDIRELFSEIGELVRYAIHFDKDGRPSGNLLGDCCNISNMKVAFPGTAEVVFARTTDAFQAFKRYNNVQLDGRLMKIEIIGAKAEIPISPRVNVGGASGKKRTVVMAYCCCCLKILSKYCKGLDLVVPEVALQRQITILCKEVVVVLATSVVVPAAVAVELVAMDVVVPATAVGVVAGHAGERELSRNQLMNLTKNSRAIMLRPCSLDWVLLLKKKKMQCTKSCGC